MKKEYIKILMVQILELVIKKNIISSFHYFEIFYGIYDVNIV